MVATFSPLELVPPHVFMATLFQILLSIFRREKREFLYLLAMLNKTEAF
jgi:hypothetical protein